MTTPSLALPAPDLLCQQAEWLAPARAYLLRGAGIAHRQRVLDLGAGHGAVTGELVRRAGGRVVALDIAIAPLLRSAAAFAGSLRVGGDAHRLPFLAATFDLVFSQLTLLWLKALPAALDEIRRILQPGGALVALEPDYGGMIEYPPAIASRDLWVAGLARAGADPHVGRKLPVLLAERGFKVQVKLFDTLYAPSPERFAFLRDLPLTPEEQARLQRIESEAALLQRPWSQVAHLPFMLVTARRS